MRSDTALIALVVTLLSGASAVGAQERMPVVDTAGIERAGRFLQLLSRDRWQTGVSAAVAIDGRIVWSEGVGFADREAEVPATPQTVYRIGSVSKIVTTAAVGRLLDQGRIDLDADVRSYVPEFPDKGDVITVRQIAGHLSGIRHYRMGETEAPKRRYATVIEALELFADDPLLHRPGERWSYSSYAWTLLSAVVARAAREPFLDYVRSAVLDPLGMNATRAETWDVPESEVAALYDEGQRVERNDISYIWAAGGFLSNVEDLIRLGSAFLPGSGFLSDETLAGFSVNQVTDSGEEVDHGIGWTVDHDVEGKTVIYHGGLIVGGQAVLYVEPADRVVVAILANEDGGFGLEEAYILASAVLGRSEPPQFVRRAAAAQVSRANRDALLAVLDEWTAAMEHRDLDGVMDLVAESFTSDRWPSKAAARRGLAEWFAAGSVEINEDLDVGIRGVEVGATSDISNLHIRVGDTTESIVLILTKLAPDTWRVTAMMWP